MIWRIDGGTTTSDTGIRIRRIGQSVLRYEAGNRHIDFTFEFGLNGASVYTQEVHAWQPNGELFTREERETVQLHLRESLCLNGYVNVDFGE